METIIKFDPTIEALHAIVAQTKDIKATDLEDKAQLEIVKRNRIDIGKARIAIEKKGKELRADALKFQKDVIAKEKELLEIINPEEDRLKQIEKDAEALALKKERLAKLPERNARLKALGIEISEEDMLSLDDLKFEQEINFVLSEKNRVESERIERERQQLEDDKKQLERDEQIRIKAEQDLKDKQKKEKKEEEDRIKKEQEQLEKNKKYNDFKSKYEFDKEENTGDEIILWKKVATYKLN